MCSTTPRFSYDRSKLAVPSMPSTGGVVHGQVYGLGMVPGTGIRVGTGEGYTGYPAMLLGERCADSEAGPGRPAGPGVGGQHSSGVRLHTPTTPCGRARSAGVWTLLGQIPASGPIRARIHQYFSKVSQNDGVSPKYVHKAYHSPCFQNGHQKSPLGKLRFPFWLAFSPKELMVPF